MACRAHAIATKSSGKARRSSSSRAQLTPIEIGCTQASIELVHQLATDDTPAVKKILDNVIVLLVPSANPDGQIMVTDWFNRNVGTPYESSPLPYLYHPYVGHDSNRDMYMFTQKESQYIAQLVWHDWYPSIWLDQHQMSANGPRIFVMPATDPINPNVHPVIYRWNTILGQSQAAALEAAGKDGIIYNTTYTNFWEGAMAWSGWWHNQIGLLTEVASARVAAPVDQQRATGREFSSIDRQTRDGPENIFSPSPLSAPTDTTPRTEYPRPWLGGHWTLRDIVDYELISTTALLDTVADRREAILRQIFDVNRQTVDEGRSGNLKAILVPTDRQQDAREAGHLVERLMLGGVDVYRADASFNVAGDAYAAGTYVIPMNQVFARYAKDLLEKQTYPEAATRTTESERRVAVRRHGLVARHAAWRRCRLRHDAVADGAHDAREQRHPACRPRLRQRSAFRSPIHGPGYGDCHQSAAEGRGSPGVRGTVPGVGRRRHARQTRTARARVRPDDRGDGSPASRLWLRSTRSQSARLASACTTPGPAATPTKGGRGGCWSSTSSASRPFTTAMCAKVVCTNGSTRSSCRIRRRAT